MSQASYSSPVNSSVTILWNLLLDKIENPQKYISDVKESKIIEKTPNFVIREMQTSKLQLLEKITVNETTREVCFTLIDHPVFTGSVINKIDIPAKDGEALLLTFSLNWQPKNPELVENNTEVAEMIKQAVLHTKALAEG